MTRMRSVARTFFWSVVLLALPGTLLAAYEMYGLTIGEPQMLFFSLAHGSGVALLLLIVLSVLLSLLWLVLSMVALFVAGYREAVGVPRTIHRAYIYLVGGHLLLLATYERWSVSSWRIWLCVLGWALLAGLCVLIAKEFVRATSHGSGTPVSGQGHR